MSILSKLEIGTKINPDAQKLVDHLRSTALQAAELERNLKGADAVFDNLTGKTDNLTLALSRAAIALREQTGKLASQGMSDPEKGRDLRNQWRREQEKIEREAQRAARDAQRRNEQRQANALMIGDIEAEIAALNSSSEVRDHLLEQLQTEQNIRSSIASLG